MRRPRSEEQPPLKTRHDRIWHLKLETPIYVIRGGDWLHACQICPRKPARRPLPLRL